MRRAIAVNFASFTRLQWQMFAALATALKMPCGPRLLKPGRAVATYGLVSAAVHLWRAGRDYQRYLRRVKCRGGPGCRSRYYGCVALNLA
jgi:hypothetical protein